MEVIDASVSTSMASNSDRDPEWAHLNDLPRPFDVICEDLAALGALSLQDFLSDATSTTVGFDVSFHLQSIVSSLPEKRTSSTTEAAAESQRPNDAAPAKHYRLAVSLLNQTSQRIFGSTDPIKFEFLEEDPKSMYNLFLRVIYFPRRILQISNAFCPSPALTVPLGLTSRVLVSRVEVMQKPKPPRSPSRWVRSSS